MVKEEGLQERAASLLLATLGGLSTASVLALVVLADLTDELVEGLLDVDASLGRSLEEGAAESLGEVLALSGGNLTVVVQIALVSNEHDGDLVLVLHTKDLLTEGGDFVKGGARGDGKDAEETLARAHVLVTHGAVLLLTGSVEDIKETGLIVDGDLLAVAVLDGGVLQEEESK